MSPQERTTRTSPRTSPQTRRRVRPAVRSAIARLDRWTLATLNPLDALPRQRTPR
ncbi:hypothetical protein [Kineosporia sp. A_224]|uniref:hypothetical protein n=1 Tax=Kineosporia sp. A_224 TaxID=1962180 RepID=UPI0013045D9F|nr:hypothetical protein [Kineosporia sp. A_224]